MATDQRQPLTEFFEERRGKAGPFVHGSPHYVRAGDFVSIYFSQEIAVSRRVDDVLTVYRSESSGELIGCKIKGVSILAENVVNMFKIEEDSIEIRLLLLNAAGPRKPERFYYQLSEKCGTATLPLNEIRRPKSVRRDVPTACRNHV